MADYNAIGTAFVLAFSILALSAIIILVGAAVDSPKKTPQESTKVQPS